MVKQHIKKLWEKWWFWLAVGLLIISVMFSLTACGKIKDQPVATVVATHVVTQATPTSPPSMSPQSTIQASTPAPTKVAKKYNIFRGPNTTKRITLTADDCPKSVKKFKSTIKFASANDIGLILFPTGQCVKMYKKQGFDLVMYASERGIWVGNHSLSHPNLNLLSPAGIKREIGSAVVSNYGRPPYGAANAKVKKVYAGITSHGRHGMRPWLWTVDTNDWKGKTRQQVVNWVINHSRKGGTVLMHMQWNGFNPTALADIKTGLAKKGLKLCGIWRGEDRVGDPEPTSAMFPDNIC